MKDKPENDPTAIERRRTFLKRMAAAGFVAGAVVTFEPMIANAAIPGEHQDEPLGDFWPWHHHRHTTTTAAPTTPAPTPPAPPTPAPTTPAPTTPAPTTPAPTTPAPTTPAPT